MMASLTTSLAKNLIRCYSTPLKIPLCIFLYLFISKYLFISLACHAGKSPLDGAKKKGHSKVVNFLMTAPTGYTNEMILIYKYLQIFK